jgi:glyoxylase-like metal-dependent hydrolase (beta-lactamase superfamily II)
LEENTTYAVTQIDETSWRINDDGAGIFVFAGDGKALVVDSGYGKGDLAGLVAELTGGLPVMLVNTHGDYDHTGANAQFDEAHMHPAEFARYRSEHESRKLSDGIKPKLLPLWEGDVIGLGRRSFEVVLIPGHSPGSIALLDSQNRILIGGDTITDDKVAMCEDWRNFDAYICSIEKLIGLRGRFDSIYTSHGSFPVGAEILDGLLAGAKSCRNGEIEGVDTDFIPGMKLYDVGVAWFVY